MRWQCLILTPLCQSPSDCLGPSCHHCPGTHVVWSDFFLTKNQKESHLSFLQKAITQQCLPAHLATPLTFFQLDGDPPTQCQEATS